MRLFIAIQFDDEVLDVLEGFQAGLKDLGVTGNYTRRENLHVTLAFIGDYGNPDEVLEAMEQADFRVMDISLEGVGSFGDLFWAGLADNQELDGYVRRLRRELAERGIPFDRKRFLPHITLIRKYRVRGGDRIPVLSSPEGKMTATRVSLMRSDRGRNGMIYTEIGSVWEDLD